MTSDERAEYAFAYVMAASERLPSFTCKEEIARLKLALRNQMTAAEWQAEHLRMEHERTLSLLAVARAEVVKLRAELDVEAGKSAGRDVFSRPPRVQAEVVCECPSRERPTSR